MLEKFFSHKLFCLTSTCEQHEQARCIDEKNLWIITIFNLQPQHPLTGYLAHVNDER